MTGFLSIQSHYISQKEDTSVIRRKFLSVERTNEDNNQLDHLFSSIVNNNVTEVRASLENGTYLYFYQLDFVRNATY